MLRLKDILLESKGKLFYHGTTTADANSIFKKGFRLKSKAAIYFTNNMKKALEYAEQIPKNIITIDIGELNIKWYRNIPEWYYDIDDEIAKQFIDDGYDGIGIKNKTGLAIFEPVNLKIMDRSTDDKEEG